MLVPITHARDLASYDGSELLADLDLTELERSRPDAHWLLVDDGPAARCTLWWGSVPQVPGETVGLIGHYAARDDHAARTLLEHACAELASRGCTVAIGPMDGSTWRRYRFVTERGDHPRFFLEPDNPDAYPDQWRAAGFQLLAGYRSALQDDLSLEYANLDRLLARLSAGGLRIRPFRPAAAEADLHAIYQVSTRSFQGAYLYAPIGEAEFLELYRQVLPHVVPELCLVAEAVDDAAPAGFLFALPDLAQRPRGAPIDTFILKTVAVLPEYGRKGLGSALVALGLRAGRERGYRRAIHALMHEANPSQEISRSYRARTMRRYALFWRPL